MTTLVRERMSSNVRFLSPRARVSEALALFQELHISAVPVLDEGALVGILSMSDVVAAAANDDGYEARAVSDLMTQELVGCSPTESIDEAARLLRHEQVHRLIVQDGLKVVGILSVRDVLREVKERRFSAPLSTIMSETVSSVDLGEPVESAIRLLSESGVHALVVVDGTWPIGVFSQTEAIAAKRLPKSIRERTLVEQMMSYEIVCQEEGTPVYRAAGYAMAMEVRRILVVKNRDLVGVVSCLDLAGTLAS